MWNRKQTQCYWSSGSNYVFITRIETEKLVPIPLQNNFTRSVIWLYCLLICNMSERICNPLNLYWTITHITHFIFEFHFLFRLYWLINSLPVLIYLTTPSSGRKRREKRSPKSTCWVISTSHLSNPTASRCLSSRQIQDINWSWPSWVSLRLEIEK